VNGGTPAYKEHGDAVLRYPLRTIADKTICRGEAVFTTGEFSTEGNSLPSHVTSTIIVSSTYNGMTVSEASRARFVGIVVHDGVNTQTATTTVAPKQLITVATQGAISTTNTASCTFYSGDLIGWRIPDYIPTNDGKQPSLPLFVINHEKFKFLMQPYPIKPFAVWQALDGSLANHKWLWRGYVEPMKIATGTLVERFVSMQIAFKKSLMTAGGKTMSSENAEAKMTRASYGLDVITSLFAYVAVLPHQFVHSAQLLNKCTDMRKYPDATLAEIKKIKEKESESDVVQHPSDLTGGMLRFAGIFALQLWGIQHNIQQQLMNGIAAFVTNRSNPGEQPDVVLY
jgi:hypothetical protein